MIKTQTHYRAYGIPIYPATSQKDLQHGQAMSYDGSGDRLAISGYPYYVSIWQTKTGVQYRLSQRGSIGFGRSVVLSYTGRWCIVGAPFSHLGMGSVYTYERQEDESWRLTDVLSPPYPGFKGQFGHAVAIDAEGQTLLVSAPYSEIAVVYVYQRISDEWLLVNQLTPGLPQEPLLYGWSIALSADGRFAAVGSINAHRTGAVYLYRINGEYLQLLAPDRFPGDGFGWSVALSADGHTVITGAPFAALRTGAIYITDWKDLSELDTIKITLPEAQIDDRYGYSVGCSATGNRIIASSCRPNTDLSCSDNSVYLHEQPCGRWHSLELIDIVQTSGPSVALSADGQHIAIRNSNGAIETLVEV